MPGRSDALVRAYAACEQLARSHYENFPVASRLLPRAMRPHVAAVYAFARIADDLADEGNAPASGRTAHLDCWLKRLHDGVERGAPESVSSPADRDDLIIVAAAHSIRALKLPLSLFDDLVSAFRQDTMTTRYASWTDLMDYCRRSANPVGRLVLRIGGYGDEALARSSDHLCTALQLTNFWQDFGRDWRAGRLYVPREVWESIGARETDLSAGQMTDAWAQAITVCAAHTREAFREGRAVCDGVRGRLRLELRLTWLGGLRVLEQVERVRHELMATRPTLGPRDVPALLWRAARWRRSGVPQPSSPAGAAGGAA